MMWRNLILFMRDLAATDDVMFLVYEWRETFAFERTEPAAVIDILARIEREG